MQRPAAKLILLVAGLLLISSAASAKPSSLSEHWLRIALDHRHQILHGRVLVDEQGEVYVRNLDLAILGIKVPESFAFRHGDEPFHRASALASHSIHLDMEGGHLHMINRDGPAPLSEDGTLLLDIQIFGEPEQGPFLIHETDGDLWLSEQILGMLNMDVSALPVSEGQVPVSALAGDDYVVNTGRLKLWMKVPPEMRRTRYLELYGERAEGPAQPGVLSARLDYEVSAGGGDEQESWQAALVGANLAHGFSHCRGRALRPRDAREWRRLDTSCSHEWPERMVTVSAGDGISRNDGIAQSARYGGVRVGSDFSLAPGMNTQPGLWLPGTARLPSTLEVWVNQNLTAREKIGSGDFVLEDIPARAGIGEVRIVLEDVLGGREVVTRDYYSDTRLLRPGLTDWSVEGGRLREGFGLAGDEYTDNFAVAGGRYGVSDWLTVAARGEYQQDAFHGFGGLATLRLWRLGAIEGGAMLSQGETGEQGRLWRAGFSRRGRLISLSARYTETDRAFQQVGFAESGSAPHKKGQASLGIRLPRGASFSAGAFHRQEHDGAPQRLYTAGLGISVLRRGHLRFSATLASAPRDDNLYGIHFTLPLGHRTSGSVGASQAGKDLSSSVRVQRNLPAGPGMGYRAGHRRSNDQSASEAEFQAQNEATRLTLNAREDGDASSGSARLRGSLLATPAGVAAIREPGTAATVQLPTAGVRIYHDNRPVATTNQNGRAVISGLRPYEANRLRLEDDDLPIHASLDNSEVSLVPGRGQAVPAGFSVQLQQHLNARLVLEEGEPVPAGSSVWANGERLNTRTGHNGFLYLKSGDKGLPREISVRWNGLSCRAKLPAFGSDDKIYNIGDIACTSTGE